jgi:hypothetical protein
MDQLICYFILKENSEESGRYDPPNNAEPGHLRDNHDPDDLQVNLDQDDLPAWANMSGMERVEWVNSLIAQDSSTPCIIHRYLMNRLSLQVFYL